MREEEKWQHTFEEWAKENPEKLKEYLMRHPDIEKRLAKNKKMKILVTDITKNILKQKKNLKILLMNLQKIMIY